MLKWFRKQPAKNELDDIKKQLSRVEMLLSKALLTEREAPVVIHHMHVDRPKLDQLTFQFDQIDIDEVSGALNIGTNSGIDVSKKEKSTSAFSGKIKQPERKKQNPDKAEFSSTPSGFRFSR